MEEKKSQVFLFHFTTIMSQGIILDKHRVNWAFFLEEISQVNVHIALTAGLLGTFWLGWMIGHGLDADATGADEAIENDRGAGDETANGTKNATAALRGSDRSGSHLYRRIFPEPGTRFNIQGLARGQRLLKDVPVAVKQDQSFAIHGSKLIDEHTCAAKEDIGSALHEGIVIVHVTGCHQELMLAYLDHLPMLEAQRDNLAHGIARESDIAWTLGLRNKDLQTSKEAAGSTAQRLEAK